MNLMSWKQSKENDSSRNSDKLCQMLLQGQERRGLRIDQQEKSTEPGTWNAVLKLQS